MDKGLTIDSLILVMGINGLMGAAMVLAAGWTASTLMPLGVIALGFVALHQTLNEEDWFV